MSELTAADFKVGDVVVGEDDDEKLIGVIFKTDLSPSDIGVRWTGEVYDENEYNLVDASLLRLWPSRAHAVRVSAVRGSAS